VYQSKQYFGSIDGANGLMVLEKESGLSLDEEMEITVIESEYDEIITTIKD